MGPKRYWEDARLKVEEEGQCRVCGSTYALEAAHISGRSHDEPRVNEEGMLLAELYVDPVRIVPLCGPFPAGCHGKEHRHELDLLPHLHLDEQLKAVEDFASLEAARRRLAPSAYVEGLAS
jgi:hypothetical protein